MAVGVSQDIMNLTREAFLVVRDSRVTGANQAAHILFKSLGRTSGLVGALLDELWVALEDCDVGQPGVVRARVPAGANIALEWTRSQPWQPGMEYAIRVEREKSDAQPSEFDVNADGDGTLHIGAGRLAQQRATQRRLEQLSATVNEGTDMIVLVDPQAMAYVDVNEAAARNYGLERGEMLERGLEWVMQHTGALNTDGLRQRYREAIARYPEASLESQVLTVPGRPDKTVEVTRRAVQLAGQWLILTVGRDVTERMAAQHRLEQLRAAVNEATDMILVIDPHALEYIEINEATARYMGLSRELMLERGMKWVLQHTQGWDPEELHQRYRDLIECAPAPISELHPLVIEGQPARTFEMTRRAFRLDGQWLIVSVSRDVTDRVRAESELHQRMAELSRSNHDLEQFAYVASHDLSEPLRMVASYTQLMARRYGTLFDDDGREFMGYIVSGAQRMKQMIDDLLTYSRAGRSDVALREWPLDECLGDALQNLEHALRQSAARIERPPSLPTLSCDRTGMIHLFQNLIANGLKFRKDVPVVIRIDSVEDESSWVISVTDNGIGIAPEYFVRIFAIFQRLHGRSAYEGTGIGLSICKKIVERHGGVIWVESTPGQGASFKFRLPKQMPLSA